MRRLAAMLLAMMMLVGCQEGGQTPEPTPDPTPAFTPEPIQAVGLVDLFPAQRTVETDAAYADFALKLLRAGRTEGENTLLSPLSVTLALGMTSAGAGGDTAKEFADLLAWSRGP